MTILKNLEPPLPLFHHRSAVALVASLAKGEIQPDEMLNESIDRISRFDSTYQALAFFDEDRTRALLADVQIRNANTGRTGALACVPVGVKDIFNTLDFPTQMGSPLWHGFTPGNDARVVFNLKQFGAVLAGKTVTAEFAVHELGATLNPHDVTRTPGTSSSGSAAGVALGYFPISLGTQTAGSIVRPASFCGVYGCKPSFGLIPRTGILKTTDSLDSVGFFSFFFQDIPLTFDLLRVRGPNYPISDRALNDPQRRAKPSSRPWRVALIKSHVWDCAAPYAQESLLGFGEKLMAMGAEVLVVELPPALSTSHAVHATIYDKSLAYYFTEESKRGQQLSDVMRRMIETGERIAVSEFQQAVAQQVQLIKVMDRFLTDFDVGICLSTSTHAPLRSETELADPSLMWTLTHVPVVSVPCFVSPQGLPFGLQVLSRKYSDPLLFSFVESLIEMGLVPSHGRPLPPAALFRG